MFRVSATRLPALIRDAQVSRYPPRFLFGLMYGEACVILRIGILSQRVHTYIDLHRLCGIGKAF